LVTLLRLLRPALAGGTSAPRRRISRKRASESVDLIRRESRQSRRVELAGERALAETALAGLPLHPERGVQIPDPIPLSVFDAGVPIGDSLELAAVDLTVAGGATEQRRR